MWPGPGPTSIPSAILIRTAIWPQDGQKLGGLCSAPFWEGELDSPTPSDTKAPGLRPISVPNGIVIHPAVWPQWTIVGCVHLGGGGAGSPSNSVAGAEAYLHYKFHLDPSNNTPTSETDRQTGQWSDSIGRTVLQTVAQKLFRLDVRKFVFTIRVINNWNSLPAHWVSCNIINTFKTHVSALIVSGSQILCHNSLRTKVLAKTRLRKFWQHWNSLYLWYHCTHSRNQKS